jgi:hypothetical protein
MGIMKKTLMLTALVLAGAAGCDQSKPELDATKAQLTAVSAERDGLRTQLSTANQQSAALQAQVTDLTAKLAAATAPPPPPPAAEEEKAPAGHKKKAAKAEVAAPAPATPLPAGATTGPAKETRRGRGAF